MRAVIGSGMLHAAPQACRLLAPVPTPCRPFTALAAKKGGGGDKKGGQKKSAISDLLKKKEAVEQPTAAPLPPGERATEHQYNDPDIRILLFSICQSYWRKTKKNLLGSVELDELPQALYYAPFAVLAHDLFAEEVTNPVFSYANRAALNAFDSSWEQLVGLPSSKSLAQTAPLEPGAGQDGATTSGVATASGGWRLTSQGNRFKIRNPIQFPVQDLGGEVLGQAAIFEEYELENGTMVSIAALVAAEKEAERVSKLPTQADVERLEAWVQEQADSVRSLKALGLGNLEPEVQYAVIQLKERKQKLADVQAIVEQQALKAAQAAQGS